MGGCASHPQLRSTAEIRLPDQALLRPPAAPKCEVGTQATQSDPGAAERAKLDYERQCYRHAELIVRDRLEKLQAAVGETIHSVRANEQRVAQH